MSNSIKSFRVDDELLAQIGTNANFSDIANNAIREFVSKEVWVPNFEIEKHAGLTPDKFLKRVEAVKYLRYNDSAVRFTLYPGSGDEIKRNNNIHAYANGNFNQLHDAYIYFNIRFPQNLLFFLKSKSLEDVNRCITGFLSLLYWLDDEKRNVYEHQIERRMLKSVIKINGSSEFKELTTAYKALYKKANPTNRARYNNLYFDVMIKLGIDPIMFPYMRAILSHLHHPFHFSDVIPFSSGGFDIKLRAAYMRNVYEATDDWNTIVITGTDTEDSLKRAESDAESWKIWLDEYSFLHHPLAKR